MPFKKGYFLGRNAKGQFIKHDDWNTVFDQIKSNIKDNYAAAGKVSFYIALDKFGARVVDRIKNHRTMDEWYDETRPDLGDLSSTYTYYLLPSLEDRKYLSADQLSAATEGLERALGQRHMEPGMTVLRRDDSERILYESEWEAHHETEHWQSIHSGIGEAKVVITTPMEYAVFVEGGIYNGSHIEGTHPALVRIMEEEAASLPIDFVESFQILMRTKYKLKRAV